MRRAISRSLGAVSIARYSSCRLVCYQLSLEDRRRDEELQAEAGGVETGPTASRGKIFLFLFAASCCITQRVTSTSRCLAFLLLSFLCGDFWGDGILGTVCCEGAGAMKCATQETKCGHVPRFHSEDVGVLLCLESNESNAWS